VPNVVGLVPPPLPETDSYDTSHGRKGAKSGWPRTSTPAPPKPETDTFPGCAT